MQMQTSNADRFIVSNGMQELCQYIAVTRPDAPVQILVRGAYGWRHGIFTLDSVTDPSEHVYSYHAGTCGQCGFFLSDYGACPFNVAVAVSTDYGRHWCDYAPAINRPCPWSRAVKRGRMTWRATWTRCAADFYANNPATPYIDYIDYIGKIAAERRAR